MGMMFRDSVPDSSLTLRMTFLVILNGAAGGVKDLERRSGLCTRFFADAPLDLHRRKEIRLECLLLLY